MGWAQMVGRDRRDRPMGWSTHRDHGSVMHHKTLKEANTLNGGIHTNSKIEVISLFHFIFWLVASSAWSIFIIWSSICSVTSVCLLFFGKHSASTLAGWITSPLLKSTTYPPSLLPTLLLLNASSFLFFIDWRPFSALRQSAVAAFCGSPPTELFVIIVAFASTNSPTELFLVQSFSFGVVFLSHSVVALAWKAQALALCFFRSAWSSKVWLLIV